MATDTPLPDHLARLGEALDRAVRIDLAERPTRLRRPRHPRRAAAVVLVALGLPAAAYAASQLITPRQIAASLPQGTKALIGTDPTCTVVQPSVEYHCVLASAPTSQTLGGRTTGSSTTPLQGALFAGVEALVRLPSGKSMLVKARTERTLKHKILILARKGYKVDAWSLGNVSVPPPSAANDGWQGTVEPTVDVTKHVNGGCRAQNASGTEWECYIGEAAVSQTIISQGFLGQYAPSPGVG